MDVVRWVQPVSLVDLQVPLPVVLSATNIEIGTVDQGHPGARIDAWFFKLTDGTNDAVISSAGALKVDGSAVVQPVSGTVTANQGTSPWVVSGTLTVNPITFSSPQHVIVDSGTIDSTQSGTWLVGLSSGSNTIGKVDQGLGGASAWKVDGSAVTQPVSGSLGRTWTLLNTTDSVNVGNFPATQPISGSVSILGTVPVSGTLTVNQGTSPWVVSGTLTVNPITFASPQHVIVDSGTISVTQGTSPWVVSGTVTSNIGTTGGLALDTTVAGLLTNTQLRASPVPVSGTVSVSNFPAYDTNYGAVGANTLRSAAQIGNATGAADFNAGATGAQTLRVTANAGAGTFAISAVSLPLPTGASTSANQTTIITSLSSIDAGIPVALGQTTMANSMPVVIASDQSTINVAIEKIASAAVTSVASSATVVTLLASNAARHMATIFNSSTKDLYLKFGSGASLTDFTVRINGGILGNGSYFELPLPVYTGIITGIWNAANGAAKITEY